MTNEQRIAIACDADLRETTAIGRKISREFRVQTAYELQEIADEIARYRCNDCAHCPINS
jgi:hypothetical protein